MKKLPLLILGVLIGALATYYFCPSCVASSNDDDDEVVIIKPSGVITPAQAIVLDKAFDSRHALISDSIVTRKGGDNRSAWWSLKDMRDYLNYAENQTSGLGYTMDGVRIYLGAYPVLKGEAGYTTMFLVPTGSESISEGNSTLFNFKRVGGDIPGGDPLNSGAPGNPPPANYPQ